MISVEIPQDNHLLRENINALEMNKTINLDKTREINKNDETDQLAPSVQEENGENPLQLEALEIPEPAQKPPTSPPLPQTPTQLLMKPRNNINRYTVSWVHSPK